jgi:hypothetical protein
MNLSIRLLVAALATWRITHLLSRDAGPAGAFTRLRSRASGTWLGQVLRCFYCLSFWVAIPLALFVDGGTVDLVVVWIGLSGAAILLERATERPFQFSMGDESDDVLQRDAGRQADGESTRS